MAENIADSGSNERLKKSDITRKKILDAAETEFAEKGLYGTRVDEIAKRSGVNKRMIYVYFGNKEELYMTVLRTVYSRLTEYEEKLLENNATGREAVRAVIMLYYDFLSRNPSFVKLVLWENLMEGKYFKESGAPGLKKSALSMMKNVLRCGVGEGVFRGDLDIEQTAISMNMFCFSSFSNIYTMSQLVDRNLNSEDEIRRRALHVCEILINYICNL